MKKIFLTSAYTFLLILTASALRAQLPPNPADPDVPIDGGITLLLAAGAGYGLKKIKDHLDNKENKN